MKQLICLAFLSTSAHAGSPWLEKLAVCNAAIAGRDGRSGVMLPADGAATERQRDIALPYFSENTSTFVGQNGKRAGLWVVSDRKSYFVDLEDLGAEGRGSEKTWNLKVRMPGRPPWHTKFGYADQPNGPKEWFTSTSAFDTEMAPVGADRRGTREVEAREYLTPELQKQMEAKIMSTLESWKETIAPSGIAVSDGGTLEILRQMENRQKKIKKSGTDERSAIAEAEKRELGHEKRMVEGMARCQKAIEGQREFDAIAGMITLVQRHLATKHQLNPRKTDDIKSDTAL